MQVNNVHKDIDIYIYTTSLQSMFPTLYPNITISVWISQANMKVFETKFPVLSSILSYILNLRKHIMNLEE